MRAAMSCRDHAWTCRVMNARISSLVMTVQLGARVAPDRSPALATTVVITRVAILVENVAHGGRRPVVRVLDDHAVCQRGPPVDAAPRRRQTSNHPVGTECSAVDESRHRVSVRCRRTTCARVSRHGEWAKCFASEDDRSRRHSEGWSGARRPRRSRQRGFITARCTSRR